MFRLSSFPLATALTLCVGVAGVVGVLAVWRQALNPYGVPKGERFLEIRASNEAMNYSKSPDYAVYEAWRDQLRGFERFGAWEIEEATLATRDGSRLLKAAFVDQAFLRLLQIEPASGRLFDGWNLTDRRTALVISHGLARTMFGEPRLAVGAVLSINGQSRTVVGVLPAGLEDSLRSVRRVDLMLPLDPAEARSVQVLGQLREGGSRQQAQAELDGWGSLQPKEVTQNGAVRWTLWSPLQLLPSQTLQFLKIALGGCVLFLLITLSNVLHLVLAQVDRERRESAIRWALGENRWRLLRRKLGQALLLTLIPGFGAYLVAMWGLELLLVALPEELRFLSGASLGWQELTAALAVCVAILLVCGSIPRLLRGSKSLLQDLSSGMRLGRPSWMGRILGQGHILTSVASAAVLLVGAYLVLASLLGLSRLELGFEPQGLQVVQVELPGWKYDSESSRMAFFEGLDERMRALPALSEGVLASSTPPDSSVTFGTLKPMVGMVTGEIPPTIGYVAVRPGYFQVLRQEIVAGRGLDWADMRKGSPAVVLSETLARYLFGRPEEAVGQRLDFDGEVLEVRGVVRDIRTEGLYRSLGGVHLFAPLTEFWRTASVVVRSEVPVGNAARNLALKMDPDVVVTVSSMESRVADSLRGIRFMAILFILMTGLAISIAIVGIYGVLNHFARRHQAQVALRMALGATPDSVLRWMLTRGLLLGGVGGALGVALSYPFATLLQGQLFGLESGDWMARLAAVVLVLLATLLATCLPAWRASRVNPVEFLKES